MNKNKKEVGATIKQIRKERGISQDTLSRKMGFKDHTALTKIETGVNDINSEALMELAKLLEVNVGIFFTGKTSELPEFKIKQYDDYYRDDMIFMVLSAKDALKKIPSINPDLLDIKSNYIDKGDMFWIALGENNRIIGCVGYETIKPLEARIHRLYIKPELKRQGIGSALLETLVKYVKEKGYNKLSIHTGDEKYWESKLFYKAKGFVEVEPNILERDI
ncbi:MAG: GNAT family N-acetyltransferase [Bacilli bacterium]|nr:GNAT family N-acetyltransferase [Bacilli bacterium]